MSAEEHSTEGSETAAPESPAPDLGSRRLLESLALLAITIPLGLWQPAFWLLVPFAVIYGTRRSFDEYGVRWSPGGVLFNLVTASVVLGGYAVGHYAFGRFVQGRPFHPALPPAFLWLVYHQVIDVALPEEFFFRAYLQTNLNFAWGRPFRLLGAEWGWSLPVSALVFALCHLFYGDLSQLKVVFFGLFAGWLRERTGSIAAPVLYHAAGNILLYSMIASFS